MFRDDIISRSGDLCYYPVSESQWIAFKQEDKITLSAFTDTFPPRLNNWLLFSDRNHEVNLLFVDQQDEPVTFSVACFIVHQTY